MLIKKHGESIYYTPLTGEKIQLNFFTRFLRKRFENVNKQIYQNEFDTNEIGLKLFWLICLSTYLNRFPKKRMKAIVDFFLVIEEVFNLTSYILICCIEIWNVGFLYNLLLIKLFVGRCLWSCKFGEGNQGCRCGDLDRRIPFVGGSSEDHWCNQGGWQC